MNDSIVKEKQQQQNSVVYICNRIVNNMSIVLHIYNNMELKRSKEEKKNTNGFKRNEKWEQNKSCAMCNGSMV